MKKAKSRCSEKRKWRDSFANVATVSVTRCDEHWQAASHLFFGIIHFTHYNVLYRCSRRNHLLCHRRSHGSRLHRHSSCFVRVWPWMHCRGTVLRLANWYACCMHLDDLLGSHNAFTAIIEGKASLHANALPTGSTDWAKPVEGAAVHETGCTPSRPRPQRHGQCRCPWRLP